MKEIELFYLSHCPYCVNAGKAIAELRDENAAFSEIQIKWIEESEETELASSRDYYYVPSLYYDREKLYEVKPTHSYSVIKDNIRSAFERVLQL